VEKVYIMSHSKSSIQSAFHTAYASLFIYYSLGIARGFVPEVMAAQSRRLAPIDKISFEVALAVFYVIVTLHIFRLYITMEMLDEGDPLFSQLIPAGAAAWKIATELLLRAGIVLTVSFKLITTWHGIPDVVLYLGIMYSAMLIWSLFALCALKKSWREIYILAPLFGLATSTGLYYIHKAVENSYSAAGNSLSGGEITLLTEAMVILALAFGFGAALFWDGSRLDDGVRRGKRYWNHVRSRAVSMTVAFVIALLLFPINNLLEH
jgi:hypothetical protein